MEVTYALIFVAVCAIIFISILIFITKKFNKKPVVYKTETKKDNPPKELIVENKTKDELLEEVRKLRELAEKDNKEKEEKKKIEGIQGIIYLIVLAICIYIVIRNWNAIVSFFVWLLSR